MFPLPKLQPYITKADEQIVTQPYIEQVNKSLSQANIELEVAVGNQQKQKTNYSKLQRAAIFSSFTLLDNGAMSWGSLAKWRQPIAKAQRDLNKADMAVNKIQEKIMQLHDCLEKLKAPNEKCKDLEQDVRQQLPGKT